MTHIYDIALFCIVCVAAATDLRLSKIPNVQILTGLSTGLFFKIVFYGVSGLNMWFFGALVTGIAAFGLWYIGAFGAGDAKLFAVVGGMTDIYTGICVIVVALFVGAAVSVCAIVRYRHRRRYFICFAPCIAIATIIVRCIQIYR